MSAAPNTHFYEMALIEPGMPNAVPPVYCDDCSDQPDAIGKDGCGPVPDDPGLGVTCDWKFIDRYRTERRVFDAD
jgi:L-alanine-DL-glutamate epimerase-like enolase superfamily enzyme